MKSQIVPATAASYSSQARPYTPNTAANLRFSAALSEGHIVGIAGLFIDGNTATLDPSAVLPEAGGQGIHAAFIAQRLTDAAEAGCDLAFVGTRLASGSHRNQRRAGLELAYERLIFQRDR